MIKIVQTDHIQIEDHGDQYKVFLPLQTGGVVEHEPFPRNPQGLVAALLLAADVCAGKFYLKRIVVEKGIARKPQMLSKLSQGELE